MKPCDKEVPKAKNGVSRGMCTLSQNHSGRHYNKTCPTCGIPLTTANASPCAFKVKGYPCRKCKLETQRAYPGFQNLRPKQTPNMHHKFTCGCAGVLPSKGGVNLFANRAAHGLFQCRVGSIIKSSLQNAAKGGYKPIPQDTPHAVIRAMMLNPNCYLCGKPLMWAVILGCKAPHLHHDHETGKIYGFTHDRCNPRAMENEIDRLKKALSSCTCKKT